MLLAFGSTDFNKNNKCKMNGEWNSDNKYAMWVENVDHG